MNNKINANSISDFFKKKSDRCSNDTYIAVLNSYNDELRSNLLDYYSDASRCGIIIENKLNNPSNEQIAYMSDIIGSDFNMSMQFISDKLQKWIQTINHVQAETLSESMHSTFQELINAGKNNGALKNAYVKFMCWLYYRFRSVLLQICKDDIPKIMYEGHISTYELYMFDVLCKCGCDVLILDYGTDDKVKNESMFPDYINVLDTKFPSDFCIKSLKDEILQKQKLQNICGPESQYKLCRNAWMNETEMSEIKRTNRSSDNNTICSSFLKFSGASDRNTYVNDLFDLYSSIDKSNRKITLIENGIQQPTPIEINVINRINCNNVSDIISMIMNNIVLQDKELLKYTKHLFCDYIMLKSKSILEIHKLEEDVLKLFAIFNRYNSLFDMKNQGCLFVLENELLTDIEYHYLEVLSNFPVDIVIFNPNKISDNISNEFLLEFDNGDAIVIDKFPTSKIDNSYSTTAFNANNDLTNMLYQDTGMYRNRQYKNAEAVVLKTTYDEIEILWREDISMRPGFSTDNNKVIIPSIFAKVCGVKDANKKQYVKSIEKLVTGNENVLFYKNRIPIHNQNNNSSTSGLGYAMNLLIGSINECQNNQQEPINIAPVLTNGNIDIVKLKNHHLFHYGYIRDETIAYMVDKLNDILKSNIIDGIGTHGVENVLIYVFFNIPKEILSMIQKFDFTKINPKIVYLNTGEDILTIEETILLEYLSLLGFDVVMFVPTGYNVVEKYFVKKLFIEHQIGEYMYGLNIDIRKKKGFFS